MMPLGIDIRNKDATVDRLEVTIEGLDTEWTAVPVPTISLGNEESQTIKVFFNPPRETGSVAGNYPFVVRVRSLISGDDRTAQGVLQIKPYNLLSLEINPKKGFIGPGKKMNTFTVTAMNLGNAEHTIQFSANDPEDACAYDFEYEDRPLAPGGQREVEVTVNPLKRSVFGSNRLIGFAVMGRSKESPNVVGNTQAQLEVRPFFTGTTIAFFTFVMLLVWLLIITIPKPPKVVDLKVNEDSHEITQGGKFIVAWKASDASEVKLTIGDKVLSDSLPAEGTQEVEAKQPGQLRISVAAGRNGKWSPESIFDLKVETPKVFVDPIIEVLSPSSTTVDLGKKFVLRYKFNAAVVKAKIGPDNVDFDLKLDTLTLEPHLVGPNEYTVIAENEAGKTVTEHFTIMVTEKSLAEIVKFDAVLDPLPTPDSDPNTARTVTITWQVSNATRVELTYPGAKGIGLDPAGQKQVAINGKTTFYLKVFDSKDRSSTRSKTVSLETEAPQNGRGDTNAPFIESTTGGTNPPRQPAGRPGGR